MDNVQSVSRVMPPQVPSQPPGGVIPHFIDRKLDFLLQARATYGDIFRIDMAGTEVVIFGHPRHLQHILVDHARNYSGKGGPRAFRTVSAVVMKNGLATVDSADDLWRQQRKAIQPHLHRRQLDPLADLMVAIIERGIAKWDDTIVPGQPFDVEPGLTHIAMNILVKTMFGTELEPDEVIRFSDRIRNVLDSIWLDLMDTASCEETLPAREHRYQEDLTVIDQMLARLVESRFQEAERGDDLITMLWQLVGMDGISRDQFRDEALSTLIAGYESTAASMSFAFMLLTQHPDVMQNLQTEIDTVLQTRRPTLTDLPHLAYARMVVQETLRFYAPSYWVQRVAEKDDEIDGFYIPAGTIVAPLLHLIHHHPDVWKNPQTFEPERFAPERIAKRQKFAWVPFGAGQRMCVGMEFALMTGQLILAQVLQRYTVTSVSGRPSHIRFGTNVRPDGGVWAHLEKRAK